MDGGGRVCGGVESGGKVYGGVESGGKVCGGLDGGGGARTSGAVSISRRGMVEVTPINDIIVDTGCAPTLVGEHLVPTTEKIARDAITLRCADSDTVLYPVAKVNLVVGGILLVEKAALIAYSKPTPWPYTHQELAKYVWSQEPGLRSWRKMSATGSGERQ